MKIPALHRWPRTPREAIALQQRLRPHLCSAPIPGPVRWMAGVDVAISPSGREVIAGVVVWDFAQREVVESRLARGPCDFPYVPGLLSFREIPVVLRALRKLRAVPDVVLADGQGIAHPRRLGLAAHMGLWLPMPTIGCAKSRLCGEADEPAFSRGSRTPLRLDGETVGYVLRSRDGVRPLYVSPGNRCNLESAAEITLMAAVRYRLPEPTRLAHQLVTRARSR